MGIESQVLQGIVEQIIVDPDKVEEAMKRHSNVSSELNRITGCRYILSGAYKRKVSVKPLDDVDLFIWFPKSYANSDSIGDLNDNINAADIITKTKKILDYANINCNEIREQSHSVGIFYNDLDFKIDVIPAFAKKDPVEEESFDHLFWIPDRESGKWLPNHPKRNERRIIKANKETKGNFHNIVRLLKYWMKQEKSSTFKSFHLELLACYIAYTKPELFDDSLFNVFKNVVGEIEFLVKNKVNISEEIEFEKNILDSRSGIR